MAIKLYKEKEIKEKKDREMQVFYQTHIHCSVRDLFVHIKSVENVEDMDVLCSIVSDCVCDTIDNSVDAQTGFFDAVVHEYVALEQKSDVVENFFCDGFNNLVSALQRVNDMNDPLSWIISIHENGDTHLKIYGNCDEQVKKYNSDLMYEMLLDTRRCVMTGGKGRYAGIGLHIRKVRYNGNMGE